MNFYNDKKIIKILGKNNQNVKNLRMLLILFPYKYTKFYHYLFEADVIKKKTGMSVEIHDLSW